MNMNLFSRVSRNAASRIRADTLFPIGLISLRGEATKIPINYLLLLSRERTIIRTLN